MKARSIGPVILIALGVLRAFFPVESTARGPAHEASPEGEDDSQDSGVTYMHGDVDRIEGEQRPALGSTHPSPRQECDRQPCARD